MSRFPLFRLTAVLCLTASLAAWAQSTPQMAPPASRAAQGPATAAYRSTFESYQQFTEEQVLPWKKANDSVGKIGGWRAYAKEAHEAAAKDEQQAPTSPSPASEPARGRP
jgi:hypothetical protein